MMVSKWKLLVLVPFTIRLENDLVGFGLKQSRMDVILRQPIPSIFIHLLAGLGMYIENSVHALNFFTIKEFSRKYVFCPPPQSVPSKDYKLPTSWLKKGVAVINVSTFKN